ncbi:hypothetical protein NQ317_003000, partial [Molorchus minor]
ANVTCFLSTDIIAGFSQLKNVKYGTIFSCLSKRVVTITIMYIGCTMLFGQNNAKQNFRNSVPERWLSAHVSPSNNNDDKGWATSTITHESVSHVQRFTPVYEKVVCLKELMKFELQFLVFDMKSALEDLEIVFHRENGHLAVVVDGDCENISAVLSKSLPRSYFYETYHWLILSSSEEIVLTALKKVKLNINSDMHYLTTSANGTFTIYDIYNPAFEHGGELVVKQMGYYRKHDGYKAEIKEDKYWKRKNMTGITFNSAIVVPTLDMPLKKYLISVDNRHINSMNRFQSMCVNYCRDFFNFR